MFCQLLAITSGSLRMPARQRLKLHKVAGLDEWPTLVWKLVVE
jgi:hypothetical protein